MVRITKLSNYRKRVAIQTYEPKRRIKLNKERTVPFMINLGHWLVIFGGFVGLAASSVMAGVKGVLGFKEKMNKTSKYDVIKYSDLRT